MKRFDPASKIALVSRALRAAAAWLVVAFGGCGQFDAQQATTAEVFSNNKVRALAVAAETGDVATIDVLVKEGVDVNSRGRANVTPLLHCLWRKNKAGYAALLHHRADPNVCTRLGSAVVHEAAEEPDPFWLRLALEHGANPNLINTGHPYFPNQTPLYYAIAAFSLGQGGSLPMSGRIESVRLLIGAGADLNHKDASGSPLDQTLSARPPRVGIMRSFSCCFGLEPTFNRRTGKAAP